MRMIGDLRLHIAESDRLVSERVAKSGRLASERIAQLESALNTTKVLVARLGQRLATAPARLWRRYIA